MAMPNENESALLWDRIPKDAEKHPDYMAIQALIHDESTKTEQVENFKVNFEGTEIIKRSESRKSEIESGFAKQKQNLFSRSNQILH